MSDDRSWSTIAEREITQKEITQVEEILPIPDHEGPVVGATLAVEAGPEAGRMLYVGSSGGVLGRSEDAGLTFSDKAISRSHARIDLRGGHFYLRDLSSVNGTFVDGQRVLDEFQLPPVCRIRIGRHTILRFTAVDDQGREREYQRVLTEERLRFEEEKSRALAEQAEELRLVNADLETMASAVSSDLRDHVVAVLKSAGALRQRCSGVLSPEDREALDSLTAEAEKMERQLDDLAAYARIGTEGELEELALDQVMAEVRDALAEDVAVFDARIRWEGLPFVMGNRRTLGQLFHALVHNSLRFRGDESPDIAVNADRDAGEWVVSVSDNGAGIPEDQREKVFQVFQRTRTADPLPGTGIGLAIAKRVVEQHHGRIWIEGTAGPGTIVRFSLPSAYDPEATT